MNAIVTLPTAPFDLAHLTPAAQSPLDAILSASGPVFMGVFSLIGDHPEPAAVRHSIQQAQTFLDNCAAHATALREADLAGYGAQLAQDVIGRRPCHHALRSALRRLRQTSRFLPSIAEVLVALDAEQSRVRNTLWHVGQMPAALNRARAALAVADRRGATPAQEHRKP